MLNEKELNNLSKEVSNYDKGKPPSEEGDFNLVNFVLDKAKENPKRTIDMITRGPQGLAVEYAKQEFKEAQETSQRMDFQPTDEKDEASLMSELPTLSEKEKPHWDVPTELQDNVIRGIQERVSKLNALGIPLNAPKEILNAALATHYDMPEVEEYLKERSALGTAWRSLVAGTGGVLVSAAGAIEMIADSFNLGKGQYKWGRGVEELPDTLTLEEYQAANQERKERDVISEMVWGYDTRSGLAEQLTKWGMDLKGVQDAAGLTPLHELKWHNLLSFETLYHTIPTLLPHMLTMIIPAAKATKLAQVGMKSVNAGKGFYKGAKAMGLNRVGALKFSKFATGTTAVLAGGLSSRVFEGFLTAGQAYSEAKAQGMNDYQAAAVAQATYIDELQWTPMAALQWGLLANVPFKNLSNLKFWKNITKMRGNGSGFAPSIRTLAIASGYGLGEGTMEMFQETYQDWIINKNISQVRGEQQQTYKDFFFSDEARAIKVASFGMGFAVGGVWNSINAIAERRHILDEQFRNFDFEQIFDTSRMVKGEDIYADDAEVAHDTWLRRLFGQSSGKRNIYDENGELRYKTMKEQHKTVLHQDVEHMAMGSVITGTTDVAMDMLDHLVENGVLSAEEAQSYKDKIEVYKKVFDENPVAKGLSPRNKKIMLQKYADLDEHNSEITRINEEYDAEVELVKNNKNISEETRNREISKINKDRELELDVVNNSANILKQQIENLHKLNEAMQKEDLFMNIVDKIKNKKKLSKEEQEFYNLKKSAIDGYIKDGVDGLLGRKSPKRVKKEVAKWINAFMDGNEELLATDEYKGYYSEHAEEIESALKKIATDEARPKGKQKTKEEERVKEKAKEGIKAMITKADREALSELGYTKEQIAKMRPEDAKVIIDEGIAVKKDRKKEEKKKKLGKVISTKGTRTKLIEKKDIYETKEIDGDKDVRVEVTTMSDGSLRVSYRSRFKGDKKGVVGLDEEGWIEFHHENISKERKELLIKEFGSIKGYIDHLYERESKFIKTITDVDKLYSQKQIERHGIVREEVEEEKAEIEKEETEKEVETKKEVKKNIINVNNKEEVEGAKKQILEDDYFKEDISRDPENRKIIEEYLNDVFDPEFSDNIDLDLLIDRVKQHFDIHKSSDARGAKFSRQPIDTENEKEKEEKDESEKSFFGKLWSWADRRIKIRNANKKQEKRIINLRGRGAISVLEDWASKVYGKKVRVVALESLIDEYGFEQVSVVIGSTVYLNKGLATQEAFFHEVAGHIFISLAKDQKFVKKAMKDTVRHHAWQTTKKRYRDMLLVRDAEGNIDTLGNFMNGEDSYILFDERIATEDILQKMGLEALPDKEQVEIQEELLSDILGRRLEQENDLFFRNTPLGNELDGSFKKLFSWFGKNAPAKEDSEQLMEDADSNLSKDNYEYVKNYFNSQMKSDKPPGWAKNKKRRGARFQRGDYERASAVDYLWKGIIRMMNVHGFDYQGREFDVSTPAGQKNLKQTVDKYFKKVKKSWKYQKDSGMEEYLRKNEKSLKRQIYTFFYNINSGMEVDNAMDISKTLRDPDFMGKLLDIYDDEFRSRGSEVLRKIFNKVSISEKRVDTVYNVRVRKSDGSFGFEKILFNIDMVKQELFRKIKATPDVSSFEDYVANLLTTPNDELTGRELMIKDFFDEVFADKEIRQYTQYANLNNLFYEHFARDLYNEMKDMRIYRPTYLVKDETGRLGVAHSLSRDDQNIVKDYLSDSGLFRKIHVYDYLGLDEHADVLTFNKARDSEEGKSNWIDQKNKLRYVIRLYDLFQDIKAYKKNPSKEFREEIETKFEAFLLDYILPSELTDEFARGQEFLKSMNLDGDTVFSSLVNGNILQDLISETALIQTEGLTDEELSTYLDEIFQVMPEEYFAKEGMTYNRAKSNFKKQVRELQGMQESEDVKFNIGIFKYKTGEVDMSLYKKFPKSYTSVKILRSFISSIKGNLYGAHHVVLDPKGNATSILQRTMVMQLTEERADRLLKSNPERFAELYRGNIFAELKSGLRTDLSLSKDWKFDLDYLLGYQVTTPDGYQSGYSNDQMNFNLMKMWYLEETIAAIRGKKQIMPIDFGEVLSDSPRKVVLKNGLVIQKSDIDSYAFLTKTHINSAFRYGDGMNSVQLREDAIAVLKFIRDNQNLIGEGNVLSKIKHGEEYSESAIAEMKYALLLQAINLAHAHDMLVERDENYIKDVPSKFFLDNTKRGKMSTTYVNSLKGHNILHIPLEDILGEEGEMLADASTFVTSETADIIKNIFGGLHNTGRNFKIVHSGQNLDNTTFEKKYGYRTTVGMKTYIQSLDNEFIKNKPVYDKIHKILQNIEQKLAQKGIHNTIVIIGSRSAYKRWGSSRYDNLMIGKKGWTAKDFLNDTDIENTIWNKLMENFMYHEGGKMKVGFNGEEAGLQVELDRQKVNGNFAKQTATNIYNLIKRDGLNKSEVISIIENLNLVKSRIYDTVAGELLSKYRNNKKAALEDISKMMPNDVWGVGNKLLLQEGFDFLPQQIDIIIELLGSQLQNNGVRLTPPGTIAYQMGDLTYGSNKLKTYRLVQDPVTGKMINAVDVIVPFSMQKQGFKEGDIIILQRIPESNVGSIVIGKIKSFTPEVQGEQVIIPSEISKLLGSDTDGDALHIFGRYNLDKDDNIGTETKEIFNNNVFNPLLNLLSNNVEILQKGIEFEDSVNKAIKAGEENRLAPITGELVFRDGKLVPRGLDKYFFLDQIKNKEIQSGGRGDIGKGIGFNYVRNLFSAYGVEIVNITGTPVKGYAGTDLDVGFIDAGSVFDTIARFNNIILDNPNTHYYGHLGITPDVTFGWLTLIGMNVSIEDTYLIMNNPVVKRYVEKVVSNKQPGSLDEYQKEATIMFDMAREILENLNRPFKDNNVRNALNDTISQEIIDPNDTESLENQLRILSLLYNAHKAQSDIYLLQRLLSLEKSENKLTSLTDYMALEHRVNEIIKGEKAGVVRDRLTRLKELMKDPNISFAMKVAGHMGNLLKLDLAHQESHLAISRRIYELAGNYLLENQRGTSNEFKKLKKQIDHDIRNSIIAEKIGLVGDSIFSIIPDSFTGHELSLEEERILNNPNLDRNQVSFEESLYVLTGFINKLINAHKIETINGVRKKVYYFTNEEREFWNRYIDVKMVRKTRIIGEGNFSKIEKDGDVLSAKGIKTESYWAPVITLKGEAKNIKGMTYGQILKARHFFSKLNPKIQRFLLNYDYYINGFGSTGNSMTPLFSSELMNSVKESVDSIQDTINIPLDSYFVTHLSKRILINNRQLLGKIPLKENFKHGELNANRVEFKGNNITLYYNGPKRFERLNNVYGYKLGQLFKQEIVDADGVAHEIVYELVSFTETLSENDNPAGAKLVFRPVKESMIRQRIMYQKTSEDKDIYNNFVNPKDEYDKLDDDIIDTNESSNFTNEERRFGARFRRQQHNDKMPVSENMGGYVLEEEEYIMRYLNIDSLTSQIKRTTEYQNARRRYRAIYRRDVNRVSEIEDKYFSREDASTRLWSIARDASLQELQRVYNELANLDSIASEFARIEIGYYLTMKIAKKQIDSLKKSNPIMFDDEVRAKLGLPDLEIAGDSLLGRDIDFADFVLNPGEFGALKPEVQFLMNLLHKKRSQYSKDVQKMTRNFNKVLTNLRDDRLGKVKSFFLGKGFGGITFGWYNHIFKNIVDVKQQWDNEKGMYVHYTSLKDIKDYSTSGLSKAEIEYHRFMKQVLEDIHGELDAQNVQYSNLSEDGRTIIPPRTAGGYETLANKGFGAFYTLMTPSDYRFGDVMIRTKNLLTGEDVIMSYSTAKNMYGTPLKIQKRWRDANGVNHGFKSTFEQFKEMKRIRNLAKNHFLTNRDATGAYTGVLHQASNYDVNEDFDSYLKEQTKRASMVAQVNFHDTVYHYAAKVLHRYGYGATKPNWVGSNHTGYLEAERMVDAILAANRLASAGRDSNAQRYLRTIIKDGFLLQNPKKTMAEVGGTYVGSLQDAEFFANTFYYLAMVAGLGLSFKSAAVNIAIGKYNELRRSGMGREFVVGHMRFFGVGSGDSWDPNMAKKGKALANHFGVLSFRADQIGEGLRYSPIEELLFFPMRWSEIFIQVAAFIGQFSKEEWESFDVLDDGTIVIAKGRKHAGKKAYDLTDAELEETGFISDEQAIRAADKVLSVQGRGYTDLDQRIIQAYALTNIILQFKRWLPTFVMDRMRRTDMIDRFGDVHIGTGTAQFGFVKDMWKENGIRIDKSLKTYMQARKDRDLYEEWRNLMMNPKDTNAYRNKLNSLAKRLGISEAEIKNFNSFSPELKKRLVKMNPHRISALDRGNTGILSLLLLSVLVAMLYEDDDEKKNSKLYQFYKRTLGDALLVVNTDSWSHMMTPPSVTYFINLVSMLKQLVMRDEYKRDAKYGERGDKKWKATASKLVPRPVRKLLRKETKKKKKGKRRAF